MGGPCTRPINPRRRHCENPLYCHISETVPQIFMKFGTMTHIGPPNPTGRRLGYDGVLSLYAETRQKEYPGKRSLRRRDDRGWIFLHSHALPFSCSQFPFLPIAIHTPKLKSNSHCNAIPTWLTFARRAGPDDKAHLGILLLTQCVYTR